MFRNLGYVLRFSVSSKGSLSMKSQEQGVSGRARFHFTKVARAPRLESLEKF